MLKSFFSHSPPMSGVNVKGTNKVLAPGIFGSLRGQPEFWFCDQPGFGFVTNRNLGHFVNLL